MQGRHIRVGFSRNSRSLISSLARNFNPKVWNTVCPSVRSPGNVPSGTTPAEIVNGVDHFALCEGKENCALTKTS
ncbi:Bgt-20002 [Blumeria graminis f. sp. tritici]|uniref:Bgt-20002 n=2 Tax=Blumeria graminis f. sp. tritici TaxID=62690 RepID=A0A381LIL4_BLUGR|nr:Bgt-20002 [Blumeria graminis f. sp. tritici]